jgi:hypothetical protein
MQVKQCNLQNIRAKFVHVACNWMAASTFDGCICVLLLVIAYVVYNIINQFVQDLKLKFFFLQTLQTILNNYTTRQNILVFYKKLPTYNPQKTTGHKPVNNFVKSSIKRRLCKQNNCWIWFSNTPVMSPKLL